MTIEAGSPAVSQKFHLELLLSPRAASSNNYFAHVTRSAQHFSRLSLCFFGCTSRRNLCLLSVSTLMLNWEMLLFNNTEWPERMGTRKKRVVIKRLQYYNYRKNYVILSVLLRFFCFSSVLCCLFNNQTTHVLQTLLLRPGHKAERQQK